MNHTKLNKLNTTTCALLFLLATSAVFAADKKPNRIVIYTDDQGYGDESALNPEAKFQMPNMDRLAKEGIIFSNGHSADSVCTPSRYGLLTGRYPWRTQRKSGVMKATLSDLTDQALPAGSAEDSVSFLPALSGKTIVSTRSGVIHHSISGHFAYRQGKWKLLLAKASGGWSAPTEKEASNGALVAQLYDMDADPGETKNLYISHPEIAKRLLQQLEADVDRGRSTDGATSKNDMNQIELWKSGK